MNTDSGRPKLTSPYCKTANESHDLLFSHWIIYCEKETIWHRLPPCHIVSSVNHKVQIPDRRDWRPSRLKSTDGRYCIKNTPCNVSKKCQNLIKDEVCHF